ncbi:lipopolysaccharide heptosyltransferase I [Acidobacteriota bacterium]
MSDFLIIRLSSLGDIIHTLPAFSALRKYYPKAKIRWIVEDKGLDILDCVPGIDQIVTAQTKRWSLASKDFWSELTRIKREIKDRDQITLDFQGLVKSGLLAYLSRSRKRIGFHKSNLKESIASVFYTDQLDEVSEEIHVISKNLKLLSLTGIQEDVYEFPLMIKESIQESTQNRLAALGYSTSKKLVVLNIGAAWETKRWYGERWVDLIQKLGRERSDLFPLLLWGTETEKTTALQIKEETNVNMVSYLTIKEVMALVSKADLLVSGDTFALQVACALARPVVGIFGPTNPKRNGPFRSSDRVAFHELECSHCYKRKCQHLDCLNKITAEEVVELCQQSLGDNV